MATLLHLVQSGSFRPESHRPLQGLTSKQASSAYGGVFVSFFRPNILHSFRTSICINATSFISCVAGKLRGIFAMAPTCALGPEVLAQRIVELLLNNAPKKRQRLMKLKRQRSTYSRVPGPS